MYISFNKIGNRLDARFEAASIRNTIEYCLRNGDSINFDFAGIDTVAPSFADECFAKLLYLFEPAFIRNKIVFSNASPLIEAVFLTALKERLVLEPA